MKHHTVTSYQKELNELQHSVIKMQDLLVDMLKTQQKAMQSYGKDFVSTSKEIDRKINDCDSHIEDLATIVLATRQPLAIDLRFVLSSIKLAVIMERMGDLSKNIIWRAAAISAGITKEVDAEIHEMNSILISMMEKIKLSYKNTKENQAYSVIEDDMKIDSIYSDLMNKISQMRVEDKKSMSDSIQIVMACKNIERIGDYITKLANILYYINTGKQYPDEI